MSEQVVIGSGELNAVIDPLGAELVSLSDAAGRQFLWNGDPAWWTGHAPILFPIIGELAGGTYRLGGRSYSLARHGFARRSTFRCEEHEPGSRARFRLEDDEATRAVYPFPFSLDLLYEVRGRTLTVVATVINRGDQPMPFSLGLHPAFAWPLPGGGDKDAHKIVFEQPEPAPIFRLDANGLLAHSEPSPVKDGTLALSSALFAEDALILDQPASRQLCYRGENGVGIDIAFDGFPQLGIWQKPGAPFLCIEPWAGLADPADFTGDFREKPGILQLAPGAERGFRMDLTVRAE